MKPSRDAAFVFLGALILLSQCPRARAQSSPASGQTSLPTQVATAASRSRPAAAGVDLEDADSVLRIAVPRTLKNRRESMAYTYQIDYRNRNFDERGKLLTDYSAKYDVIFVEGLPYRRLTEENRKPLSPQEAANEDSRYQRAFEERSRMSIDQKRDYLKRPWNVDFPLPQLVDLFSNRVIGEEAVDGRQTIVIESVPRADVQPADEEQRRALHKQVKLWVDREDMIVSRIEATLVADDASMKKGTRARIEFLRKDGVYLPAASDVQFEAINGAQIVKGETQEKNRDFQRFHVDVRLLMPSDPADGGTPAQ
jgi:hypothetical protein